MRRFLADAGGELRLVILDRASTGEHTRTEFRVAGRDGRPVRTSVLPDVAGLPVEHEWGPGSGRYFTRLGPQKTRVDVNVEQRAAAHAVRPCRRQGHPRRKCPLCDELDGARQ